MKINDILGEFGIFTTGEEQTLLDSLNTAIKNVNDFNPREQVVINNLIKKSLVTKINRQPFTYIKKNEI